MNKDRFIHWATLLLAITGFVFSISDKILVISALNPQIAQLWPQIMAFATILDRLAKLTLAQLTGIAMAVLCFGLFMLPTGCVTGADGQRHLTPRARTALDRTEMIVGAAVQGAIDGTAADAERQLVNTGKIDASTFGSSAALGALGAAIRAAVAPTKTAIADSASNYTETPGVPPPAVVRIAPMIKNAIREAVDSGAPLVLAKEAAAKGADAAVQSANKP